MGEVTTATIATTPKNTTPTTFQSISGFALPSVSHNNQPLLQVSYCETSAAALCGTTALHVKSYHAISNHAMSYHIISFHIMPCHIVTYHIIPYHIFISCHIISYHVISYQTIPHRIMPYHVIYHISHIIYDISYIHHIFPQTCQTHCHFDQLQDSGRSWRKAWGRQWRRQWCFSVSVAVMIGEWEESSPFSDLENRWILRV